MMYNHGRYVSIDDLANVMITIFMSYKGIDYFTATKAVGGKTSIAVLNFDNVRKFKDYEWLGNEIAAETSFTVATISFSLAYLLSSSRGK